jgi:hypothetical protein
MTLVVTVVRVTYLCVTSQRFIDSFPQEFVEAIICKAQKTQNKRGDASEANSERQGSGLTRTAQIQPRQGAVGLECLGQ